MNLLISIVSGILGRMGGAHGYDTKYRDWGCSACVLIALTGIFGWHNIYLAIFMLHWGAFSTYWQKLFHGIDNMWFSGLMVGFAVLPLLAIHPDLSVAIVARSTLLCVIWGCLNKYLPPKVWLWTRDIVEEFLRYFAVTATLVLLM